MYSYEIEELLKGRDEITADEYTKIFNVRNSPQIDHIQYNPFNKKYCVWTNDGYAWSFFLAPIQSKAE